MKKLLILCLIGLMLRVSGCVALAVEEESPFWSDEEWAMLKLLNFGLTTDKRKNN